MHLPVRGGSDEAAGVLPFCHLLAFRGLVYQQTYGTVIGSPVSVTIVNLVMEDVEERALATTDIPLRFWKRCVNDTCTTLLAHRLQEFLSHLNGVL